MATGGQNRIITLAIMMCPNARSAVTNLKRAKKRGTATPVRDVDGMFRVQTLPSRDSPGNATVRGSALDCLPMVESGTADVWSRALTAPRRMPMTDEHVVRWTDAAGRPRRLRFCERSLGGYDRVEEEWTGDRWRTVGREVVTEVRVRALDAPER